MQVQVKVQVKGKFGVHVITAAVCEEVEIVDVVVFCWSACMMDDERKWVGSSNEKR